MNNEQLLEAFENCTLAGADFDHRNHVRLAWIYLHKFRLLDALGKFSVNLKKFATSLGQAGLYHETITFAYLFLINERIKRGEKSQSWEEFAVSNDDLLARQPNILSDYYRAETIGSDFAREVFVMPDITRE